MRMKGRQKGKVKMAKKTWDSHCTITNMVGPTRAQAEATNRAVTSIPNRFTVPKSVTPPPQGGAKFLTSSDSKGLGRIIFQHLREN